MAVLLVKCVISCWRGNDEFLDPAEWVARGGVQVDDAGTPILTETGERIPLRRVENHQPIPADRSQWGAQFGFRVPFTGEIGRRSAIVRNIMDNMGLD